MLFVCYAPTHVCYTLHKIFSLEKGMETIFDNHVPVRRFVSVIYKELSKFNRKTFSKA